MSDIPARLHASVVERAGNRCEYCRVSQAQQAAFLVDDPRTSDVAFVSSGGVTRLDASCHLGFVT